MAAALALGLLTVGTLSTPAIAGASGSTLVNICSNTGTGGHKDVTCNGLINGNPVTVTIGDV
ncbi:MAG TPA: hypothetical protein VF788_06725, partial [Pseudonocardiaceae bacterium]